MTEYNGDQYEPQASALLSLLPVELRIEIYTYLLTVQLPSFRSHRRKQKQQPATKEVPVSNLLPCQSINDSNGNSTNQQKTKNPRDNWTSEPTTHDHKLIHTAILTTCKQVYTEALPILYTHNTFEAHPALLTTIPSLFIPSFSYPSPPASPSSSSGTSTPSNPSSAPEESQTRHHTDNNDINDIHLETHKQILNLTKSITTTPQSHLGLIRRWRLRVRLDQAPGPIPPMSTLQRHYAAAFSGCDELTLELFCALFAGGHGVAALRCFEGVRDVRRVRVLGAEYCALGFEGYLGWLRARMMSSGGEEEGEEEGDGDSEDDGLYLGLVGDGEDATVGGGRRRRDRGYRCTDETEKKRLCGWWY